MDCRGGERARRRSGARVPVVDLTPDERAVRDFRAALTLEQVTSRGARDRIVRATGLVDEIEATGAELAAAKCLNLYPTFLEGRYAPADVGLHYQVRSTRYVDGHLIVHPDDPLDHRFVLVIVLDDTRYDVAGTVFGREAARRELVRDRRGGVGWWVPRASLAGVR